MAPKSFWKGYLKLSLVTCRVSMTPATTDNEKIQFHTLNRKTHNRLTSRYVDAETGDVVDDDDEVKGYERADGDYVLLEDDEIDAVALESTRTIDIEMFVPDDSVRWIWYDRPHYLLPDDAVGEEAFSVIREAMRSTGKFGIARLVMYRRERAVMLVPSGRGIILWTLRYGDEVRDPAEYFGDIDREKADSKLLKLVKEVIEERSTSWDPDMVTDPVQEKLADIIAAKKKGRKRPAKVKAQTEAPAVDNVIDIMDALRKSIASEKKSGKR
ncbi:Ku protein [Fodinicurvata sp. EGI_FJ10296]|uniref:non-homologous end joining protein Ku n=1 Tax=Fodinicurvata sp. EGI_FJ10296 TaxID=3231908 RepID=UPI003453DAE8